jgi:hypothetical protein
VFGVGVGISRFEFPVETVQLETQTLNWKPPKILLAIRIRPSLVMVTLIFSTRSAENQQMQRISGKWTVSCSIPPSTYPVDNKSNIVFFIYLIFFTFLGTHIALYLLRVLQ